MVLDNVRIVLVRPRGAANVGAVARAMKNMGLGDLALVQPETMKPFWTEAMAAHADDVLQRVRRCTSIAEAVADCGLVVGTTCRDGLYRSASAAPRTMMPRLVAAAAANRVAVLFGPEDHGLSNEDIKSCQQLMTIPTDPAYTSLNLAQAVMICCYELMLAAAAAGAPAQPVTPELAAAERVELMFRRLQAAFVAIGYLHASNPDHIMFAFRRFLGRAQLEDRDVRILLALARQIEWYGQSGWKRLAATPPAGGAADTAAATDGDEVVV